MGLSEFDALSKSYGLATALLIVAVLGLAYAVRVLYKENKLVHERIEQLSGERVKALETLLADESGHPNGGNPRS
jgi:hypothetical protein